MNQTIQELFQRKSVRAYSDEDITSQEKELILQSALQAPTAGNMTLYSIVEVKDQKRKNQLAKTCDNQPFIAKAPLVLLFLADYQKWYDMFQEYHIKIPKLEEADLLLAMEDCMIAAQNAVVAAESLGIGSCYIGDILENYEIHQKLFHLPQYAIPTILIVFGKPTPQQINRVKPRRFDVKDIVSTDIYYQRTINETKDMFMKYTGKNEADLQDYFEAFAKRKFYADFHQEMNRSVKKMIESWKE